MRAIDVRNAGRAVLGAILLLSCVLATTSPASAAGVPRRIAIAPFEVLTKEDIGSTVSVLPRLLASRLMALAGADVVLLPAGAPPEEKAREAKVPLLLRGTVSKLGKGYSIDASVTELETGKPAGAFFVAAATEDDIIAQMGILSGEIAAQLFGVQGASRAVASPASVAAPSPGGTQAIAVAPVVVAPGPVPALAASPAPAVPSPVPVPAPAPPTQAGGWVPSSLMQVGQSDQIVDEIYGVVAGDVDMEGNGEVVAFGRNSIYVYRVKGSEILPYTRITRGISHHFLNVEAVDLDGDGKKDLVVTDRNAENLSSFVLLRKGDGFVEIPGSIPYHLVVLRDWNGRIVIAGQRRGVSEPFQGKIHSMKWNGKTLVEGEALPLDVSILPLSSGGVYSLSPALLGTEWQWLYVDVEDHLRILGPTGKSAYRSKELFGAAADGFEYGEVMQLEGRRAMFPLRRAPRVVAGPEGAPLVVTTEVRKGVLQRVIGSFESSRIVILQKVGGGFAERAASPKSDFLYSGVDLLPTGGLRQGGRIIASVIEQAGSAFKDRVSRLVLLRVE
ncbi:MAG: FG-GAP repeat domain-containing protein [Desulfobacteria bacterium]